MREAARHVAEILLELRERVQPGHHHRASSTVRREGDRGPGCALVVQGLRSARPSQYPAVLCVSVNDEIVHGIPGPRVLRTGTS